MSIHTSYYHNKLLLQYFLHTDIICKISKLLNHLKMVLNLKTKMKRKHHKSLGGIPDPLFNLSENGLLYYFELKMHFIDLKSILLDTTFNSRFHSFVPHVDCNEKIETIYTCSVKSILHASCVRKQFSIMTLCNQHSSNYSFQTKQSCMAPI